MKAPGGTTPSSDTTPVAAEVDRGRKYYEQRAWASAHEALSRESQVFGDGLLGFSLDQYGRDLRVGLCHLASCGVEFLLLAFN